MGRPKGSTQVTTPLKRQISRDFNLRGGVGTHGAAAATAEEFGLTKSNGPSQVLKYDAQVRDGTASRSNRPHTGRNSAYNSEFGERITGAFNAEATTTYREVAKDLEKAEATVRRWAKEKLGYRSLNQTVRPTVSDDNRTKRLKMARSVVGEEGPTKNQVHQDEKWFKVNTRRRKLKVRKSYKAGAWKLSYVQHS